MSKPVSFTVWDLQSANAYSNIIRCEYRNMSDAINIRQKEADDLLYVYIFYWNICQNQNKIAYTYIEYIAYNTKYKT